jgi:precorrin-6B methylase 2
MLITEDYRAEQATLHARGDYGTASLQYGKTVRDLLERTTASSLLDYGCGSKRSLLQALQLPADVVYEGYDPAIPAYAEPPMPAELVCCIDVLEHIEPGLLDNVLDHLADLSDPYGFFTVHTGPARKVLTDGRNAHLTQQGPEWWLPRFKSRFDVLAMNAIPSGFALVVRSLKSKAKLPLPGPLVLPSSAPVAAVAAAPKAAAAPGQLVFKRNGARVVLGASSDPLVQELQNTLGAEPEAIEWLDSLPPESTFLDVGSGLGAYALYAAVARQAVVCAVEPDAKRRAGLTDNIAANHVAERVTTLPLEPTDGNDGLSLDQLVAAGTIPAPTFLRVDAGERSFEVLRGAAKLLRAAQLEGLLVRTSGSESSQDMVRWLVTLGLELKHSPAERLTPNLAFRRAAAVPPPWVRQPAIVPAQTARGRSVLRHVLERVAAAQIVEDPFPYSVIDNILPDDYYAEVLAHFPSSESLRPIGETGRVPRGAYEERLVVLFTDDEFARMTDAQQRFWKEFASWMYSDLFLNAFVAKFGRALEPRLSRILETSDALKVRGDALLVNDQTNYAVGPHTDAPHRLVTFLFYLPRDSSMRELGTSVYKAKDPSFTCWGGPHHPFDKFDFVRTVEFLPNRLLAFPKTERSFHGVEKIEREGINRPLLINNIRLLNAVTH